MRRILAILLLALVILSGRGVAAAQSLPAGVPKSATKATVVEVKYGDTISVQTDEEDDVTVLLAGIDAPNKGECYYGESKRRLKKLLPEETVVYLETSGTVDKDGDLTIRYVWLPGEDGKKAALINTKLVREGFAGFNDELDTPKYFERLEDAQADAIEKNLGLWKACGQLHLVAEPVATREPTQAPVATGWSAEELAYVDWLLGEVDLLSESMMLASDLTTNFQPTDIFDQNWIFQMAAVCATWQLSYDNAIAYVAPPAFAEVHALWIEATAHYANASDYMIYGIDNLDGASIDLATQELYLGTAAMTQSQEALERVKDSRGL
jgi:endonuclease YncB( thermonuclease family)